MFEQIWITFQVVDGRLQYACSAVGFETKSPNIKISAVIGSQTDDKTEEDVTTACFYQQSVLFPPIGLSKVFPTMKSLIITSSSLKYLKRSDFQDLKEIVEIDFADNLIQDLQDDTFDDLVLLEMLLFQQNKLTRLPEGIFKNLLNLEYVVFLYNKIETLPEKLFRNNLNLRNIDFTENNLFNIAPNMFDDLPVIMSISFSLNQCLSENFEENELENLPAILRDKCSKSCSDLTKELSIAVNEATECEDELEKVVKDNTKIKQNQKACLLL